MRRDIWEFMAGGENHVIRDWLTKENISLNDQAKLDAALDRLRTLDFGLVLGSKLLAGPLRGSKLYKLRVRGKDKELRPMLCRGPLDPQCDYTLLQGAVEADSKLHPGNAQERAEANRGTLKENQKWRALYK